MSRSLRHALTALFTATAAVAQAQAPAPAPAPPMAPTANLDRPNYRCPGKYYTNVLSAKEAAERGCTTLDGVPITVFQTAPRRDARPATPASGTAAAPGREARIDPAEQRARDTDMRRILEGELRKEEERLAQLQRDYNNGEPERRGDERNYAKYQERVADLKAAVARKEADVAALKRELSRLPPS